MYVHYEHDAWRGHKKVFDVLELKLHMAVGHHAGARNHTWFPWKSRRSSPGRMYLEALNSNEGL